MVRPFILSGVLAVGLTTGASAGIRPTSDPHNGNLVVNVAEGCGRTGAARRVVAIRLLSTACAHRDITLAQTASAAGPTDQQLAHRGLPRANIML
jgi:hypothetical protein